MIELLMVIVIVSILGAVALPQFLDFRNEAKVASIHQSLSALRVAVKNHMQQAILRCGAALPPWTPAISSWNLYELIFYNSMVQNDITSTGAGISNYLCTTAQVPNPEDRKFIDLPASQMAMRYSNGLPFVPYPIPINPYVTRRNFVYPVRLTSTYTIDGEGGKCAMVDVYTQPTVIAHWYLNRDDGDIFAGTNTPGINECNF